jgi:hypothetical protein
VTWQQRAIGVAMLVVLMIVPAAATMCAIVCAGSRHAAQAADHCHEASGSSSLFQLRAAPAHDCGRHDSLLGEVSSAPQPRLVVVTSPASFGHVLPAARDLFRAALTVASTAPPGSDPLTAIPTVLRV